MAIQLVYTSQRAFMRYCTTSSAQLHWTERVHICFSYKSNVPVRKSSGPSSDRAFLFSAIFRIFLGVHCACALLMSSRDPRVNHGSRTGRSTAHSSHFLFQGRKVGVRIYIAIYVDEWECNMSTFLRLKVSESPFSIPVSATRQDLSGLITHLLQGCVV